MSSCPYCKSSLGCAVDCSNAPWNWDKPKTIPFGYLKRLVKWLTSDCGHSLPLGFRPNLHWTHP